MDNSFSLKHGTYCLMEKVMNESHSSSFEGGVFFFSQLLWWSPTKSQQHGNQQDLQLATIMLTTPTATKPLDLPLLLPLVKSMKCACLTEDGVFGHLVIFKIYQIQGPKCIPLRWEKVKPFSIKYAHKEHIPAMPSILEQINKQKNIF